MDAIVNTPPLLLQAIFASASELAKATRFVQRIRQLQPDAFARTFCLFLIAHPKASLELLADQLSLSTQRGGLLSGRSVWRAWQIVVELLPQLLWALSGRMDWWCVWEELVSRLDKRPQQPLRKRHPSTRQRLFQASLIA